jgi:hypothetical protein
MPKNKCKKYTYKSTSTNGGALSPLFGAVLILSVQITLIPIYIIRCNIEINKSLEISLKP